MWLEPLYPRYYTVNRKTYLFLLKFLPERFEFMSPVEYLGAAVYLILCQLLFIHD